MYINQNHCCCLFLSNVVEVIMELGSSSQAKPEKEKETTPTAAELLEKLNSQIQREKQEIESIAVAIKRNENLTHIPGLDGDFPHDSSSPLHSSPLHSSSSPTTTILPTSSVSSLVDEHIRKKGG